MSVLTRMRQRLLGSIPVRLIRSKVEFAVGDLELVEPPPSFSNVLLKKPIQYEHTCMVVAANKEKLGQEKIKVLVSVVAGV